MRLWHCHPNPVPEFWPDWMKNPYSHLPPWMKWFHGLMSLRALARIIRKPMHDEDDQISEMNEMMTEMVPMKLVRRLELEWKFLKDHQKIFQSDWFPPNLNVLKGNQIWFWVTKHTVGERGIHKRNLDKRGKYEADHNFLKMDTGRGSLNFHIWANPKF